MHKNQNLLDKNVKCFRTGRVRKAPLLASIPVFDLPSKPYTAFNKQEFKGGETFSNDSPFGQTSTLTDLLANSCYDKGFAGQALDAFEKDHFFGPAEKGDVLIYLEQLSPTIRLQLTEFVNNAAMHDAFFGNTENLLDGIAFYQSGVLTHYGEEFPIGSRQLTRRLAARVNEYYWGGLKNPRFTRLLAPEFVEESTLFSQFILHIDAYMWYPRVFWSLAMQPSFLGAQWGQANFNKGTRVLYNNYNAELLVPETLVPYAQDCVEYYKHFIVHGWNMFFQYPHVFFVWIDSIKEGIGKFRASGVLAHNAERHTRLGITEFYFPEGSMKWYYNQMFIKKNLPTFNVSPEIMDNIYKEQDWLTLLTSYTGDIKALVNISKLVDFWEINHFYQVMDNQYLSDVFTTYWGVFFVFSFLTLGFSEYIREDTRHFNKYVSFYERYLNLNVSGFFEQRTKPFFEEYTLLVWFSMLTFYRAYDYGSRNGLGSSIKAIYDNIMFYRHPEKYLKEKEAYYYDRYENYIPAKWEDVFTRGYRSQNAFHRYKRNGIYDSEELYYLVYSDYFKAARANARLAYDQAIYNFYRTRNGPYLGGSFFHEPGSSAVHETYTWRTKIHKLSIILPRDMRSEFSISTQLYNFTWYTRRDMLEVNLSTYADIFNMFNHINLRPKYRLSSKLIRYLSRKFEVLTYYGAVNESNQTPLYDSELVKIRYGFDPHYSNGTAYGHKWLRILDTLEAQNKLNSEVFLGSF